MKAFFSFVLIFLLTVIFISCKKETPTEPSPFDKANLSKGGIMYDKFWSTEAGYDQNNPNLTKFNTYSDFFRCKQCHGWDLLGSNGAYISRGPKTTRPNVSSVNLYQFAKTKSSQEIFDALKKSTNRRDISYDLSQYNPTTNNTIGDQMPNYSQLLTDAQIWDIVKFLKDGAFDVAQLYDATYSGTYPTGSASFSNIGKDGNATNGKTYFSSKCASCHGSDGKTITLEGMTLGKFARSKPNEAQHKVKYGQLGAPMTGNFDITLGQMKDLYKAIADTVAFPN